MLTGYLATLAQDVLLNMGILGYSKAAAFTKLGVTDGAPDFDPGIALQDLEFDGKRMRYKGQTRRVEFQSVIKGTAKEFGSSTSGGQIALWEPGSFDNSYPIPAPTLSPSASGGTLATGTYYYRISAIGPSGESLAGIEASCNVTGPTGSVTIPALPVVPGATSLRIYRGTSAGGEGLYFTSALTGSFTDTGGAGNVGTPITSLAVTTITPKAAGTLYAPGDYVSNLRWIFERGAGGFAAIYFPIALCRKWSMKGQDKKEAQISFEFEAVGDPSVDLGTAPYLLELRTALPTT